MSVDDRLHELGIELPSAPPAGGRYHRVTVVGEFAYVSGQTANVDGVPSIVGKLGAQLTVEHGQGAARAAALNCLAQLRASLGALDRVERLVKLNGYVASSAGFTDQPAVVDGASRVLEEVLGAAGEHSRTSVGVAELPRGAPVEVELIALVRREA